MPSFITPNSYGSSPVREFNPNHEPGGTSVGGQFAKSDQRNLFADPATKLFRAATFVQHPEREIGHNVVFKGAYKSEHLNEQLDHVFGFDNPDDGIAVLQHYGAMMVQDVDPSIKFKVNVLAKIGEEGVVVTISANNEPNSSGDDKILAIRTFHREGDQLTVEHNAFEVGASLQGHGIAKDVLRNSVGLYRELGVSRISTLANIDVGGYAWAKYGFLNGDGSDEDFANDLRSNIEEKRHEGKLSRDEGDHIERLINTSKRTWIWDVADATRNGKSVGKHALMDTNWYASLSMKDPKQLERLFKYVGASK